MENIISTEQMESLKALADINLKISEAKNTLFKLQEEETEYLVLREQKAMDRIQKVVDESTELVKEADQNHAQIKELFIEVSQFAEKLLRTQESFQGLITEFEERNVEWEKRVGEQQDDITQIRNQFKAEKIEIENTKSSIAIAKKALAEEDRKIKDRWSEYDRAVNRLKEKRV